jgi:hypothetical protein
MANLTIKDLSDHAHQELKNAAREQGRSLNSYLVSLLESSADERQRRKLMRQDRDEFRRFVDSLPPVSDSTPLIREDRDRDHR